MSTVSPTTGLPRLLAGLDDQRAGPISLVTHKRMHGSLPRLAAAELVEVVEASGLRGRGGADFPTGAKLRAVLSRRRRSAAARAP